jgi:uncharacterized membrane protein
MARREFHRYVCQKTRSHLLDTIMYKLWFISPDRLAVIITDYPQIQFNRTEPETSHPILVVTKNKNKKKKKKKKKNLAKVNTYCSLPQ